MNGLIFLLIIFCLALLLETKPFNLIFNFVGILLSISLLIGSFYSIGQYLSYILIIVYSSALTILFGFIIMLNPDSQISWDVKSIKTIKLSLLILLTIIGLSIISIINMDIISIYDQYYYIIKDSFLQLYNVTSTFSSTSEVSQNFNNLLYDQSLLNKLGDSLYNNPTTIIKLLIASLILFLALVSLFFLLLPTI